MTRAVGEGAADAANEDGAVASGSLTLALLGAEIGELRAKFLGVHKGDLAGQRGRDVREGAVRHGLGSQQGAVDAADDVVKEVHRAILRADGALPVPLIDVERVDVVQLFVGADSVHVRVEPLAGRDTVSSQLHALPLGQRVNYLGASVAHVFDGERYGALHAVEVVVQARIGKDEERRRDASEAEGLGEFGLEGLLEQLDGVLHAFRRQHGAIVGGEVEVHCLQVVWG